MSVIINSKRNLGTFVVPFKLLFSTLTFKRKFQCFTLIIFAVITTLIEVAAISSILPFLSFLSSEDHSKTSSFLEDIASAIFDDPPNIAFWAATFVLITIIANISRVTLLVFQTRLSQRIGAELANTVYCSVTNKNIE